MPFNYLRHREQMIERYGQPKKLQGVFDIVREIIDDEAKKGFTRLVGLAMELRRDTITTTHSAPVGENQSWRSPNRYPGYAGRIWIRYEREPRGNKFNPMDCFRKTLTHTGTGGGGDYDSPWKMASSVWHHRFGRSEPNDYVHRVRPGVGDVNEMRRPSLWGFTYHFYYKDWPSLWEADKRRDLLDTIGGDGIPHNFNHTRHKLRWDCPQQLFVDDRFLSEPMSAQAIRQIEFGESKRTKGPWET